SGRRAPPAGPWPTADDGGHPPGEAVTGGERDRRAEAVAGWEAAAAELTWARPWEAVYRPDRPGGSWFVGGTLNAAANCLDRHLPERAGQVALHWEGETGERRTTTYGALHAEAPTFPAAPRRLRAPPAARPPLHL